MVSRSGNYYRIWQLFPPIWLYIERRPSLRGDVRKLKPWIMVKTVIATSHLRIAVRIATHVVTEICVTRVDLENSADGVCGDFQTFAINIATTTFVRYKFNSCWRNFYT